MEACPGRGTRGGSDGSGSSGGSSGGGGSNGGGSGGGGDGRVSSRAAPAPATATDATTTAAAMAASRQCMAWRGRAPRSSPNVADFQAQLSKTPTVTPGGCLAALAAIATVLDAD